MFHPGDKIGPYTLLRTIGRGAFGEVWLGERRSSLLTTQVALKMPLVAENEIESVRQEAALWLLASGHPNIVPVLDAEVYDGQVLIASEFIAGGNLRECLQANDGKAPSIEEAVAITNGILAGLDYLHRVGLIHRDLKPANVLLQDGIPRLTDFGLARILKTEDISETFSGTPRYMAPETFSGSYSIASDLWAVGVLFYELLTGSHPFPTTDLMALIMAIKGQASSPLPENIPKRLRYIVAHLLAKSPSDRFASASIVREALRNSLQSDLSLAIESDTRHPTPYTLRNNLPAQPTSFIGREKQIDELKALLEKTHLLTLTGSGGCGKTRLSLQLSAMVLEQFSDGVWLVELAPLADPALVSNTVADVLNIRESPGEPIGKTLAMALKEKELLLILDNCEHVLDETAKLVDAILRSCPKARIIASSREPLSLAGEIAYRVPSLSLPDLKQAPTPQNLSEYESVRLFIARATAAKPEFKVTQQNSIALASVCHRLDGIPLAIELGAARIRSMTLEEINNNLDNRFRLLTGGSRTALPRQQTLRAMIDWSHALLEENQKAMFARLSVFAGGWTLEAAERICAAGDIEEWLVLDLLASLVDKSLVVAEEQDEHTRYRLLETIRQYGRDMLEERGEREIVRERHQSYFLALAEEAEPQLLGLKQAVWLHRLEREHDNLRAALEFSNKALALRIAGALWGFWDVRGYLCEGREWLIGLLEGVNAQAKTPARAKALRGAGALARSQGNLAEAQIMYEESLALNLDLGDKQGVARTLACLGYVAYNQGDYPASRTLLKESIDLHREVGDNLGAAWSLHNLGEVSYGQGDYCEARIMYEESLEIFKKVGDEQGIAWSLLSLGDVAHEQGDCGKAGALYEEGLALFRETGNKQGIAYSLNNLGRVAHDQANYTEARLMYKECLTHFKEVGDKKSIACSLEAFAALAASQEEQERGLRLWGAAEALREDIGAPLTPADRTRYDREVAKTRAGLNESVFAAVWSEGRALNMDQAIHYALKASSNQ